MWEGEERSYKTEKPRPETQIIRTGGGKMHVFTFIRCSTFTGASYTGEGLFVRMENNAIN